MHNFRQLHAQLYAAQFIRGTSQFVRSNGCILRFAAQHLMLMFCGLKKLFLVCLRHIMCSHRTKLTSRYEWNLIVWHLHLQEAVR